MPGWHIHMNVARKALAHLETNATAAPIFGAHGPDAATLSGIACANPAYATLGAIGPDIFFLLPDFKPPVGNMLFKLAKEVRDFYTRWDDAFLGPYESALTQVGTNARDELNALTGGLQATMEDIAGRASACLRDEILNLLLQQYDFFGILTSGVPAGYDEQTFFWSDMLHYRETYRFAAVLWQHASDPAIVPDPTRRARYQAFALGWMSHLATDVTGHAFVNQKAGGPYRLHWQRHHLVENHMDAVVYKHDHGAQPIYNQMSNAALHLWLAFNPDGSSRVDAFAPEPNPAYLPGDHSADVGSRRHAWDVDSEMPGDLAAFIAAALRDVYTSSPDTSDVGMVACCPTILSSLKGTVPTATNGVADANDVSGAYWWLYHYVKWTTTDFYNIRRPDPPELFVVPSFPLPPGSTDADPGPGATDASSFWEDALDLLLALAAWAEYIGEVVVWPAAVVAGVVGGAATYPLREILYEAIEVPLYSLWLGVHSYLAMTGYVMPMPGEINAGLTTLGVSVADGWAATVVALGDPDGGITPGVAPGVAARDPSGYTRGPDQRPVAADLPFYPKDVLLDPPSEVTRFVNGILRAGLDTVIGPPAVRGELPSEYRRPWRWPDADNAGNPVHVELPETTPGPFAAGMDANALFGAMPGSPDARAAFERAPDAAHTAQLAADLLPRGLHLGDPQDYTAYVVATLTRTNLDLAALANFNLDADRGYAYLCWDWVRARDRQSGPAAFKTTDGTGDRPTLRTYPTPVQSGYGWSPTDQVVPGGSPPPLAGFDPNDGSARVRVRYIGREGKFA